MTRRKRLCFKLLHPILKALFIGSFDWIRLKSEPSCTGIADVSVSRKRCALPGSVVIGAEDTLEGLAARYRLSVAQLLRANPCLAPDDFTAGTTVKLPQ